jgi:hypothetical protein
MMKNHEMDVDELEYFCLIKDSICYKEDISAIQVCIKNLISFRCGSARASKKQTMTTKSSRLSGSLSPVALAQN